MIGSLVTTLSACGGGIASGDSGLFGNRQATAPSADQFERRQAADRQRALLDRGTKKRSTIWDLFSNNDDPNVTVEVNKYHLECLA